MFFPASEWFAAFVLTLRGRLIDRHVGARPRSRAVGGRRRGGFYAVAFRGLDPRRAIGVAVVANGASFLVGRVVGEHWQGLRIR